MTKIIISMLLLLSLNLSAGFVVNNGILEYQKDDLISKSEFYTKACENGNMNRCVDLGVLYFAGTGVQENHKKAEELFTIACNNKHSKACCHLGTIYKRGSKGITKNLKKSKMFYAKGCMHGYAQSCDQFDLIKEKTDTNRYRYYTDEIW
jgi:TPR repeat protein